MLLIFQIICDKSVILFYEVVLSNVDTACRFYEICLFDLSFCQYNDSVSSSREGLMSYKQFIQELEDDILPSEAERRYVFGISLASSVNVIC